MNSNFPHEAVGAIDKVLTLGRTERDYPDCFWRTLYSDLHVKRALAHIKALIYPETTAPDDEDHLAHALTRLAMAVACREAEREQKRDK